MSFELRSSFGITERFLELGPNQNEQRVYYNFDEENTQHYRDYLLINSFGLYNWCMKKVYPSLLKENKMV